MNPFARLADANIFVVKMPSVDDSVLVVATLHPFDVDGRGYELRLYRLQPRSVDASPDALDPGGWGIGEIRCADGNIRISREDDDDDLWIDIRIDFPIRWEMKSVFLISHPDLSADGQPAEIAQLLQGPAPWTEHLSDSCDYRG